MIDGLKGNLKDHRLSDIVTGLQKDAATGTLQITVAAHIKKVFFKNGNIIYAASDDSGEQPGGFLLREGHITFEEYSHLSDVVSKTGQDIKKALVKYGYASPEEIGHLLKRQVEEIILPLFAVEEGWFEFHSGLPSDLTEMDYHFNPADMVYKGIIRINSVAHLQRWCPPLDAVLSLTGAPRSMFRDVVPDDTDKKILSHINGLYSMKMVLKFSPVHDFEALRRICAFLGAGIIRIKGRDESEARGTPSGPQKTGELPIEQAVQEKEKEPAAPEVSESEAVTEDSAAVSVQKRNGRKWVWVSLTAISIILTLLVLAYVLYINIRKRSPEPVETEERIPLPPFRENLLK